jgi:serine/threonine protein kinase
MSTITTSSALSSIGASFGSWPMDRDYGDVRLFQCLYLAARRFLAKFQDKYVFKFFDDGSEMVERELRMMILAGDCSVTPLGRIFKDGQLYGIIMPYETSIIPPSADGPYMHLSPPNFTRSDKLRFITQLRILVSRLHEKGIIHGDVKPSNLLLCSDEEMRFCDFGDATVDGEGNIPRAMSVRYSSPFMCKTIPLVPLTKAEDIYATGISIWEIYTGRIPFADLDDDMVDDVVKSGARPDITLIDDAMVAELIVSYLDSGDRSLHESMSP